MNRISVLKEKLAYLRDHEDFSRAKMTLSAENGNLHLWWSRRHYYQLGACLEESAIRAIESQHHMVLPDDYRQFLIDVGNGGAGPVYGLSSLETGIKYAGDAQIPDFFEREFSHTTTWKAPAEICDDEEDANNDQLVGSLPIGDFGCGISFRLIINGYERGNIWLDDRANGSGIGPMTLINGKVYEHFKAPDGGVHVDFFTWYNTWLDENIVELNGRLGL